MACEPIHLRVEEGGLTTLQAASPPEVTFGADEHLHVVVTDYPDYAGAYEVTPSATEQVLATAETILYHDVVVAPIPSNYGLITWNGSTITVS